MPLEVLEGVDYSDDLPVFFLKALLTISIDLITVLFSHAFWQFSVSNFSQIYSRYREVIPKRTSPPFGLLKSSSGALLQKTAIRS